MYTISYSRRFWDDTDNAYDYITNVLDNESAAKNLLKKVKALLSELGNTALYHPKVNNVELAAEDYRSVRVGNYSIFYTVDEQTKEVHVIRFLYSRQDWITIIQKNTEGV
jgi:addiction module RelE/StbE family toxin